MGKLLDNFNGSVLYFISWIASKSCRFQVDGLEHLEVAQKNRNSVMLATWHGQTMTFVSFFLTFYDVSRFVMLMPDDSRGRVLEIYARKSGSKPFPVDLTEEGGMRSARKILKLVQMIKGGQDGYINPDGPSGPAYVIKPGVTYIAQKAGVRVVPMGAYCRHAYRLNRWDQYLIPFPFSRISVYFGEALAVEKGEDLTAVNQNLTNLLHRATAQAAANYYEKGG